MKQGRKVRGVFLRDGSGGSGTRARWATTIGSPAVTSRPLRLRNTRRRARKPARRDKAGEGRWVGLKQRRPRCPPHRQAGAESARLLRVLLPGDLALRPPRTFLLPELSRGRSPSTRVGYRDTAPGGAHRDRTFTGWSVTGCTFWAKDNPYKLRQSGGQPSAQHRARQCRVEGELVAYRHRHGEDPLADWHGRQPPLLRTPAAMR
jgi:hypothetical protein